MSRFRPSRNYISGEFVITGGPVDITGDLIVSGTITANEYQVNVINTNVTHIDADGNTKFGDTPDDTHQFTGSVFINGPLSASSIIGGGATTPGAPATSVQYNDGGLFAGDADFVWDNTANALTVTGDITASSNISGAFFYGDGAGLTGITATAAPAGSNTEVQFNADGVTAADADFTWLTGSNTLVVTGDISGSGNVSGSFFYGDGSNLTNTPAGSPAGLNTQIQFNADSSFGSDADLAWASGSNTLTVTGDISASVNISGSAFYGNGANLTDLNASNVSAGTLDNSHLPATISVTNVTASALVSSSFFYGDGSNLINLPVDSPAGSNTQIQFNADGAFGADTDLVWASGSNVLSVAGIISASAIAISSSNPAETLLNISGYNFPNLLNVDASSSLDGGARVMIRNSNDTILDPNASGLPRGVLHLEQNSTSSAAITSNGISLWTDADENYESAIRLHTWNPNPGAASVLGFYTNEGAFPNGFVQSGQTLGRINFGGQTSGQTALGYFVQARSSQTWNGTSTNGSYLQFYSVPDGLGSGVNIKERIRFTGDGHLIVFPYAASDNDTVFIQNSFITASSGPALQIYGPTLFGSSSINTHIFTGSVSIEGNLTASANISASFFYGDGSNLTNLPAGSPAGLNTEIQFNADGAFGSDTGLTWASASNTLTVNGPLIITGSTSELQTPEIQFDINHVATGHSTGRLYWDDDAKTITADMQGSSVRLQIGQEEHIYAKNASGVTISNGDAVRISGATGTNIEIEKAISEIRPFTAPVEQDAILGIATEEILNNQSGYVTTFGQVRDINTSGFSTGDILYLSHTVSGSLVNIKPPAPYFGARVGVVEVVNATTGVILSRPAEPLFLSDIASITSSNVPVGVPSYLCYNESTQISIFTNELSGAFSGSFQGDGSNLTGLARDFGPSATDPAGSPNAGDFYYNTVLNMTMHYDLSRTKWLSVETAEINFGRNGQTGVGAYYRGADGRSYSSALGRYAEHSGTIVSLSYTRGDVDAAVFNVTSDGTTVSFLSSSALNGSSLTLDDDFSANTVLGVRNQLADGNTTLDVLGVARMKWRI